MEKINFKNKGEPGANPINADDLNLMQNNVENSFKSSMTTSNTDTYNCNYINSIIESGSNSNGNWIKFNDGTMIQMGSLEVNAATYIELPYGGYRTFGKTITLPVSFINSKYIISVNATSDTNNNGFCANKEGITNNSFNGYFWTINKNTTELIHSIDYITIGKWK